VKCNPKWASGAIQERRVSGGIEAGKKKPQRGQREISAFVDENSGKRTFKGKGICPGSVVNKAEAALTGGKVTAYPALYHGNLKVADETSALEEGR